MGFFKNDIYVGRCYKDKSGHLIALLGISDPVSTLPEGISKTLELDKITYYQDSKNRIYHMKKASKVKQYLYAYIYPCILSVDLISSITRSGFEKMGFEEVIGYTDSGIPYTSLDMEKFLKTR